MSTLLQDCHYDLLAQCIRSDQLSAEQISEVFEDEVFSIWYRESLTPSKGEHHENISDLRSS